MKNMDRYNQKKSLILDSAKLLLSEEGHSSFSMRNVARNSNIHLKSLQYYFPTKQDLITELLDYTLEEYYLELNIKFARDMSKTDSEKALKMFVAYTFDNNQLRFVNRFFPELWAMASHDKDTCISVDLIYTHHREKIAKLINAINPDLSARTVAHRSTIIATAIEGMIIYLGEDKPKHKELTGLRKEVIKQCLIIAKSS